MEGGCLIKEEAQEILLHRDIHFAGQFPVMLDYYESDGKGVCFEIADVQSVAKMEEEAGHNLAPFLLSEGEMAEIAKIRTLYIGLRKLCEQKDPENPNPRLIAELILAEAEEEQAALAAIIERGKEGVPELISLATNPEFASPLFPGYGKAPLLAICALGAIGDKRAFIPLFELIGHDDLEIEQAALQALPKLRKDGEPFLLNLLESKPINLDTERAAMALTFFLSTEEIKAAAKGLLTQPSLSPVLTQYLDLLVQGDRSLTSDC